MDKFSEDGGATPPAALRRPRRRDYSPVAILRRIGVTGLRNRRIDSIKGMSEAHLRDIGMNPMEAWLPRSCLPPRRLPCNARTRPRE